jgi:hypothetical protein
MKKGTLVIAAVLLVSLPHVGLSADAPSDNPALDETVTVRLGPFWGGLDATVKEDGRDFTIDENIDTGDVKLSVFGLWRITPRFRLEAGYSGIDRSASDGLDQAVQLGSLTIPAGLRLDSQFETRVLRLALGYAFFKWESGEFGADLGVNYTSIEESFRVTVPGFGSADISALDVSEPLPTIGLFFNYGLTPRWYLTSRVGAFAFEIGDIDGTVFDLFGGIEYRPWEHVGLGIAYTHNSADVTVQQDGRSTDVEWDYGGPFLYVVFGF